MKATDGSGLRKRQSGFTQVPNETIFDEDLPNRALGILSKVLSLPNGWDLRTEWLLAKCPHEGRDAVMGALRTLRKLGYYRVERRRRPDGTFTTGVSASEVRVPEWAAQHAQACADQGTDKPKWDVSLRLLDDGRVEDEPVERPELGVDLNEANAQVEPPNGFPVSGEPVSGEPVTGEPVTGRPDVKERLTTNTSTHSEGVSLVSRDAAEQPPLDAPDGTHRTCPQHRVTPALGPCTPCGQHRVAWERRESMLAAHEAEERMAAADAERRVQRELRALSDAEQDACGLCDAEGTAIVTVPGPGGPVDDNGNPKPQPVTCVHDNGSNIRGVLIRRQMREDLAKRRPAVHGRKG